MTGSDNSASAIEGVSGVFIALSIVTIGLRFLARKRQGTWYGVDDWCILISLPFILAYYGCVIGLVRIGWLGWGAYPFPATEFVPKFKLAAKITVASDVALLLGLALTKASALLLYRRIFCASTSSYNRAFRYAIYGTLAILPLWVITFCFLAGFQCGTQLLESYQEEVISTQCAIGTFFVYGLYISDLILDVWVVCLPIPSILRLHTTVSKKLLTIGLFSVALIGVIASAIRLVKFLEALILHSLHFPESEPEDMKTTIFFYGCLELGTFVASINLAVLWGLFTRLMPEQMIKMARSVRSLVSSSSQERRGFGSTEVSRRGSSIKMEPIFSGGMGKSVANATHEVDTPPVPEEQRSRILISESFQVSSSTEVGHHVRPSSLQ